jgi:hypothetical protein
MVIGIINIDTMEKVTKLAVAKMVFQSVVHVIIWFSTDCHKVSGVQLNVGVKESIVNAPRTSCLNLTSLFASFSSKFVTIILDRFQLSPRQLSAPKTSTLFASKLTLGVHSDSLSAKICR